MFLARGRALPKLGLGLGLGLNSGKEGEPCDQCREARAKPRVRAKLRAKLRVRVSVREEGHWLF